MAGLCFCMCLLALASATADLKLVLPLVLLTHEQSQEFEGALLTPPGKRTPPQNARIANFLTNIGFLDKLSTASLNSLVGAGSRPLAACTRARAWGCKVKGLGRSVASCRLCEALGSSICDHTSLPHTR